MFATSHVFAGALVGMLAGDRPAAAFAAGLASHVVMDLTPHWADPDAGEEAFLRVARRDGLAALAAAAAVLAAARTPRRALVAGIAGAVLLDADKPSRHFFGRNPFEGPVDRFHVAIQREAPHRMRHEVATALALGSTVLGLLAARRRPGPRAGCRNRTFCLLSP